MTVEQILETIAPELTSDTEKNNHITLARQRTSTCFGDNYNYAVALRAAHTLTLKNNAQNGLAGSVGGITSKREGDLSIGFGGQSATGIKGDLGTTSYGVQLDELIKGNITGISVVSQRSIPCE